MSSSGSSSGSGGSVGCGVTLMNVSLVSGDGPGVERLASSHVPYTSPGGTVGADVEGVGRGVEAKPSLPLVLSSSP